MSMIAKEFVVSKYSGRLFLELDMHDGATVVTGMPKLPTGEAGPGEIAGLRYGDRLTAVARSKALVEAAIRSAWRL